MMLPIERDWTGLYSDSWTGEIVPDAFAHPAKYARALIRKIYQHLLATGYVQAADRIAELSALDTLADASRLPPLRCHALKGDRAGQFAVDTIQNYRMIFEPAHDPIPLLEDGSIDRKQITTIRILEVDIDYHG